MTTSLAFSGGAQLAVPSSALSGLGLPVDSRPETGGLHRSRDGGVTELPGRYDPKAKSSTFWSESLSTTFVLATDTTRPVARALANATVKRGKKATLRYSVADGRPTATVTIAVSQGKKVKKTLRLGQSATGRSLVASFVCKLPAGTYTYTVKAVDRLGKSASTKGRDRSSSARSARRLVVRTRRRPASAGHQAAGRTPVDSGHDRRG